MRPSGEELLRGVRHLEFAAARALEDDVLAGLDPEIADCFVRGVHLAADETVERRHRVLEAVRLPELDSGGLLDLIPKRGRLKVLQAEGGRVSRLARLGDPADRGLGDRRLESRRRRSDVRDRRDGCGLRGLCRLRRHLRVDYARRLGRRCHFSLTPGDLDPLELLPGVVVAAVHREQGV